MKNKILPKSGKKLYFDDHDIGRWRLKKNKAVKKFKLQGCRNSTFAGCRFMRLVAARYLWRSINWKSWKDVAKKFL